MAVDNNRSSKHMPEVTLAPVDRSPDSIRAWIISLCAALNVSASKLAAMAEISHTTLSRFQSSKSGVKNLSASTIGAINSVVLNAFTDGMVTIREDNLTGYQLAQLGKDPNIISKSEARRTFSGLILKSVDIIGSVGANIKQHGQSEVMWTGSQMTVLLDPKFMFVDVYGLEMREENNSDFRRGDILICTSFDPDVISDEARFIVCSMPVGKHFENLVYICKRDPRRHFWLVPTWANSSPDQAVKIGEHIELGLGDLDTSPLVVISSLRQEI